MSIYSAALGEKPTGITMWVPRPPKVMFDEAAMPYDRNDDRTGMAALIDWDDFEDMLISGKFHTKSEAVQHCRKIYELIYDEDDEETHWTKSSWRRIRDGLFPEALAAFVALPHSDVMERVNRAAMLESTRNRPGARLLAAGKCKHNHKIEGPDDLASIGPDSKGRPRLGCLRCRRERTQKRRAGNKGN